jgi:hypothetical protein
MFLRNVGSYKIHGVTSQETPFFKDKFTDCSLLQRKYTSRCQVSGTKKAIWVLLQCFWF